MLAWRRTALNRRVLVNLKTDKAVRGVLVAQRGPILILKDAELLEAGRDPVRLDGDVIIERSNMDFAQALTSPEG
jgi:small nuclear ribonucleoprotein (snRNP)-like protein